MLIYVMVNFVRQLDWATGCSDTLVQCGGSERGQLGEIDARGSQWLCHEDVLLGVESGLLPMKTH